MINEYLESIKKRDPAAKSKLSILLTYPGIKALFQDSLWSGFQSFRK